MFSIQLGGILAVLILNLIIFTASFVCIIKMADDIRWSLGKIHDEIMNFEDLVEEVDE